MTATSPSQLSVGIPPLRHWHQATWPDYIALRDAPIREQMQIGKLSHG